MNRPGAKTLVYALSDSNFIYMGSEGKFASRFFGLSVPNTADEELVVEYWNGSTWNSVEDLIDQTFGLSENGFVFWTNKTDWMKQILPGIDKSLFYVRVSATGAMDLTLAFDSILDVYSDDKALEYYYPELVTDTRFLPENQTNFIPQHLASARKCVDELKSRGLVEGPDQILDGMQLTRAAVHACAMIILRPIVRDDQFLSLYEDAERSFRSAIGELTFDVDKNKDGVISEYEKQNINFVSVVRR
jgi:hypothetical protein